jgi:hypothetical protein
MFVQRFMLCLLLAATMFSVFALDRPFPDTVKRGTLSTTGYSSVLINGKERKLSPSAVIRNQDNLIEQPASLQIKGSAINYTENFEGDIDRIWILNSDEASRPLSTLQK